MKINTYKAILTAFLVGVIAIPAFTSALETGGQNTSGGSNTTNSGETGGHNTTGGASNTPAPRTGGQNTTGGSNTSDGTETGGHNTSGGSNTGGGLDTGGQGTTGGSNTGGGLDTGGQGTTGGSNTGGGLDTGGQGTTGGSNTPDDSDDDSNGGGGSGGSRRNRGGSTSTILPPLTNLSQCLYLNSYLKFGWNNSVSEMIKLQSFLKNTEKIEVATTGIFDTQTLAAVHKFQAKYLQDVMVPWGVRRTSGFVYYTTKKKINEIYCKTTFSLTPAQLAEIEAYRKNVGKKPVSVQTTPSTNTEVPSTVNPATGEISTTTPSDIGSTNNGGSQVAGAGELSFGAKIWNFIKWIFGVNTK